MPLVHVANSNIAENVPIGKVNFPAFDSTYFLSHAFWLLIAFGIFYLFIAKIIVPLVGNILAIRRDRIASDLDTKARLVSEAEGFAVKSEQALEKARYEFKHALIKAKNEAKEASEKLRKDSQARLRNIMEEAAAQVEEAKAKGYNSVAEIVKEILPLAVKSILGTEASLSNVETVLHNQLDNKRKI